MTPNQEIIVTQVVPEVPCSEECVLLQELDHRIINEFACAISAVSLAAARTRNEEIKRALSDVARMPEYDTLVDAAAYLRQLCLSISQSKLDYRQIRLVLVAEPLRLEADKCRRLGMIMHELINNAAEHAFASGNGTIQLELASAFVECKVQDNGSAAASAQPGRGLKIISELTKGLSGRFGQSFGTGGSTFVVSFPSYPYLHSVMTRGAPAGMGEIIELSLDRSPHALGSCGRGIDNCGPRP